MAKNLGCNYGNDSVAELECMQQVSWVQIEEFVNRYNSSPSINFGNYIRKYMMVAVKIQCWLIAWLADEKYIFANETTRYREGLVAQGPAIRSDAAREMASSNDTATNVVEEEWDCTAVNDAYMRKELGLDTYRYFWAGECDFQLLKLDILDFWVCTIYHEQCI